MPIEVWTGGSMHVADALEKLRHDGFPVDVLDVGDGEHPQYDRRLGESADLARARWESACRRWDDERTTAILAKAGDAVSRLIAEASLGRSYMAEWRSDKGAESATLRLAAEHCRLFPGDATVYVIGSWEALKDLVAQGIPHRPRPPGAGEPTPEGYPAIKVRAYLAFMAATLALVPRPGITFPVTVGFGAYAIGIHAPNLLDSRVEVGVMPTREYTGVVGATVEQVAADLAARVDAGVPTFNSRDWKAKLRLRRLTSAKSDNPS